MALLDVLGAEGRSLSELVAPLRRYAASGEINSRVVDAKEVIESIEKEHATAPEISQLDGLLVRFVGQVAGQLREEGLMARTVVLKLRHGDFHTVTRRHTLREATDLDAELLAPARALFRPAFDEVKRRRQGVRLIGVAATNLSQAAPADLFEPAERTRMRELTSAIDRARKKYGFDVLAPGSAIRLKQREEKDE